jgi:hypothetical protein
MNDEQEENGKEAVCDIMELVSCNFPEGKKETNGKLSQDRQEVRKEYLQNTSMESYISNSLVSM